MKKIALVVFGLMVFGLVACSSGDSGTSDRLAALEAEVKALKQEAQVREKNFRGELTLIRKNLEGIQDILKLERGRAEALDTPEAQGDAPESDLNARAKSFVNESLDRLLELTRKLLDKMEKEFDEQMKKDEKPEAPERDEV